MRKLKPKKRESIPDPIYQSVIVTHLINQTMKKGKKIIAQKLVYTAMSELNQTKKPTNKEDSLKIFLSAIENIKPNVELRARKVGGARYQVPFKVRPERQLTLAIRWLLEAARQRKTEKSMIKKLRNEILAAHKKEGAAMKKKETIQKMAKANRAFAYYSW